MNFFYHNDDPLLQRNSNSVNYYDSPNNISDAYSNLYKQQLLHEMHQQQMNNEVMRDWIGELDTKIKGLKPEIIEQLNNNEEFSRLNQNMQNEIQSEIMSIVKYRLNGYQNVKNTVKRQMEIIDEVSEKKNDEERKSMLELNDYIKNYSHLTFDEYKRIKNE